MDCEYLCENLMNRIYIWIDRKKKIFIFKFLYEISLGWLDWNFLNSYTKGIYRTKKRPLLFLSFLFGCNVEPFSEANLLKFERLIYKSCKNGQIGKRKWEVEVQFRLSTSSEFLRDFLINRWRYRYTDIQGMWWNIDNKTFYEERDVKYITVYILRDKMQNETFTFRQKTWGKI